jgi:hypothetical protein
MDMRIHDFEVAFFCGMTNENDEVSGCILRNRSMAFKSILALETLSTKTN